MASIQEYKGRGWQVRWRTPDRKDRSKVFARKADAKAFEASVEHAKVTGTYVDPGAGRITLRAYAEEWRKAQAYRPATAKLVESTLRLHVYPILGDRPLRSIRHTDIQGWITAKSAALAPSTVKTGSPDLSVGRLSQCGNEHAAPPPRISGC